MSSIPFFAKIKTMIKLNFMNLITNKNYQGLSSAKAKEIMEKYGPNIRQAKKQKLGMEDFLKLLVNQ